MYFSYPYNYPCTYTKNVYSLSLDMYIQHVYVIIITLCYSPSVYINRINFLIRKDSVLNVKFNVKRKFRNNYRDNSV